MSTINKKSNVFFSLLVLIFVTYASVGNALTINSTGFVFDAANEYPTKNSNFDSENNYLYDFETVKESVNKVGSFSFSEEDIQKIINGNYYAVGVGLTFSMFDGDTASNESDYEDLFLSLGNSTSTLIFDNYYLNGFPDNVAATDVDFDFKIGEYDLGVSLADLVQKSSGDIIFYIYDSDVGGNKLFFDDAWESDFKLSITFDTVPVPEPGTLFLISSGLLGLIKFRKKIVTGMNS